MTLYSTRRLPPNALACIAVAGWVIAAAAGLLAYRALEQAATLSGRALLLADQAQEWHRKAGKAYTAYLHAAAPGAPVIELPPGASFACERDVSRGTRCDPNVIYPPAGY